MSPGLWKATLTASFLIGTLLRLIWLDDMEYKSDQDYLFLRSQNVFNSESWPWIGMPSGVGTPNPGLSVWIFVLLAKLFGIQTPVGLASAIALLSVLASGLLASYVWKHLKSSGPSQIRDIWLWAICLALVNPFSILYERQIWQQSALPLFCVLLLICFFERRRFWGLLGWGFFGALLGQIHMSGFFFALTLVIVAMISERHQIRSYFQPWLIGSLLGSLLLLPWLHHLANSPSTGGNGYRFWEVIQLRYFVYWLTNPLGLVVSKQLGPDFWSFVKIPWVALAHLVSIGIGILSLATIPKWVSALKKKDHTALLLQAALFCGILLTLSSVTVYRHYLIVTFPLAFVFTSLALHSLKKVALPALFSLWIAQIVISASFLGWIHEKGGAPQGDYGISYRLKK